MVRKIWTRMAKFLGYESCPNCRRIGGDRRGDNLALYDDGGWHCFSCGNHRSGRFTPPSQRKVDEHENKGYPADFSREVPARAWQWLLQYGLGWKYWQPFVGWSEKESRLVITTDNCAIGRYIPGDVEGRPVS